MGTRQQAHSRQRAEQVVTTVLQGPVTSAQQVKEVLKQHGFMLYRNKEEKLILRESATAVQLVLASLQIKGRPLHEQVTQAIERTQQEQQKRLEVARNPRSMHATILVQDVDRAVRVGTALENAGASVWQALSLPDKGTSLSVSYGFDWNTIEQINNVLSKARQSEAW